MDMEILSFKLSKIYWKGTAVNANKPFLTGTKGNNVK